MTLPTPFDLLIAFALIASPDAKCDCPPCPLMAFQSVGVSLEILDPQERSWRFVQQSDFAYDLSIIRERYQDLRDAPPIADAIRFPQRECCRVALNANREYQQWLEARTAIDHSPWITEAIEECEVARQAWDCADDANGEFYYVSARRASLKRLLELIGPHAYYAGCLPPFVPVWRYRRVD